MRFLAVLLITSWFVLNDGSAINQANAGITIDLRPDGALAILRAVENGDITAGEIDAVLQDKGVEALIKQAARFDDRATKAAFREGLLVASRGETPSPDPFQFGRLITRLGSTEALLQAIDDNRDAFSRELANKITPYSPDGLDFTAPLYLIAGGSSDGFSKEGALYVALDFFDGDWEGLQLMAAHELYHAAQSHFLADIEPADKLDGKQQAIQHLRGVFNEGLASVVGDAIAQDGDGAYLAWFRRKFERNLARIDQNFLHFENMLYRLYHDADGANAADLYHLGFSGAWDSPHYFVGYAMAKAIEHHKGREAILDLFSEPYPAVAFARLYIETYRENPDENLVSFAPSIEAIITDLVSP